MQVDHSGLWDVSGAWEVLIWRGETVREELASSVCLDAQDSTHTPHTRPRGETCIVLCTSVCEGDEFGYFVREHATVLLSTDQSRTRTLRNFQPASLLCLRLEVGLWEWKNAQMYFENQHSLNSAPNPDTWASDYRLMPHLDLWAQNTKGRMKFLAWWGGDQKSNTLVIPQCWLWFIGHVGLQMSFTVDFGTKIFAVWGWFV